MLIFAVFAVLAVSILFIEYKVHKRIIPGKKGASQYTEVATKVIKVNSVYSNKFIDVARDGNLYIKNNDNRIITIHNPEITDIDYSKIYKCTSFRFKGELNSKGADDAQVFQIEPYKKIQLSYKLDKKPSIFSSLDIDSPFFSLGHSNTDLYRFVLEYKTNIGFKLGKYSEPPFYIFRLNYYNNKVHIKTDTLRIYFTNSLSNYATFNYYFIPPKGADSVGLEIREPSKLSGTLAIKKCGFYEYPEVKPQLKSYNCTAQNGHTSDTIIQIFDYNNRCITRTINTNQASDKVDINLKIKYKGDLQSMEEDEPIDVSSNDMQYLGRDMKIHNYLGNGRTYVSDYTTPYFSRFNDNALYCLNGYTSVATKKNTHNYNVNMYACNHNDDDYFLIGSGGEYTYTYTQKFNKNDESELDYSVLLNYRGPAFVPSRTPFATHGTFIITSHPDSNSVNMLNAMMYGSSNKKSPLYEHAGFLYHKIPATWGFFTKTEQGYIGIDKPDYKKTIEAMSKDGIEAVPHTITGISPDNTRNLLKEYMPELQKMGIEDWIDHSLGYGTRCADIKSEGSLAGNSQYSMDLFKQYGYKYCWSYVDASLSNGIDMLSESQGYLHPQIFFKNNNLGCDGYSMYQWDTYRPKNFIREVDSSNLNEIVNNDGICIMHDYFTHPMQIGKFFTVSRDGNVTLTPKFEDILKMLDYYRENKKLYIPTVKEFIDYSTSIHNIDIKYNSPDSITIDNKNQADIDGFTLITTDSSNKSNYMVVNLHPGYNNVTLKLSSKSI